MIPKISVIIPVYNVAKYLHCCIDSVLAQTFTDFELLLIDDGSKDNSGEICDEYARKDNRVRVFHKENEGVSVARNIGIGHSSGTYLMFLDSDDWLESSCLDYCLKSMKDDNLDFLQFGYARVTDDGNVLYKSSVSTQILNRSEFVKSDNFNVCVWGALFRMSIIHKHCLAFKKGLKLGEDQLFLFDYLLHCNSCRRTKTILYNYRWNASSACVLSRSSDCMDSIKAFAHYEHRRFFEPQVQRSILRYFLFPILINREITLARVCNLVKNESFRQLRVERKMEVPFFFFYRLNRRLGLYYLSMFFRLFGR